MLYIRFLKVPWTRPADALYRHFTHKISLKLQRKVSSFVFLFLNLHFADEEIDAPEKFSNDTHGGCGYRKSQDGECQVQGLERSRHL